MAAITEFDYEESLELNSENLTQPTKERLAEIRNEKISFVFQFHYLLPEFNQTVVVVTHDNDFTRAS